MNKIKLTYEDYKKFLISAGYEVQNIYKYSSDATCEEIKLNQIAKPNYYKMIKISFEDSNGKKYLFTVENRDCFVILLGRQKFELRDLTKDFLTFIETYHFAEYQRIFLDDLKFKIKVADNELGRVEKDIQDKERELADLQQIRLIKKMLKNSYEKESEVLAGSSNCDEYEEKKTQEGLVVPTSDSL